jgi:hypothetical protein
MFIETYNKSDTFALRNTRAGTGFIAHVASTLVIFLFILALKDDHHLKAESK